jgi:hypothetical protein
MLKTVRKFHFYLDSFDHLCIVYRALSGQDQGLWLCLELFGTSYWNIEEERMIYMKKHWMETEVRPTEKKMQDLFKYIFSRLVEAEETILAP